MQKNRTIEFEAIGTKWVIDLISSEVRHELKEKIIAKISDFSHVFSRFEKDSFIYRAREKGGRIEIPEEYRQIINLYEDLYKLTDGKFTPLVGSLLEETGYDSEYSLKEKKLNPVKKWDEVISFDGKYLRLTGPAVLDFGAGGKGFLTDIVGRLLEQEGCSEFTIDASGDILHKSVKKKVLKVGLEHPANFNQVIGVAEISNGSICASAGNKRKWGNYHHILNPYFLKSVNDVLAVWVVAESGLLADSLATALFLQKPESFNKLKFEYIMVFPDYSFKKSEDFPGEIFYN
jgi:FAD:protein FMN transferase